MREATDRLFRERLEQHDRAFLKSVAPERAFREREFDRRFHERTEAVVASIMTRPRALMHDHGPRSEIVVTRRRTETDGKIRPSRIAFEFQVLTDPETHGFPVTTTTRAFVADPANNFVLVHENPTLPQRSCRGDRPVPAGRPRGRSGPMISSRGGPENAARHRRQLIVIREGALP